MPSGQRMVLTGMSRLTVRVAHLLAERGARVVVITDDDEPLLDALPRDAEVVLDTGPLTRSLNAARVATADCLLALSEHDIDNLRVAAVAHDLAPDVPVVLRAFDARVAEQLEAGLNVRRCYSSSALAAPAFVAAILGEEVLDTLRLGVAEVPLCRLTLAADSPLLGLSPGEMKEEWGCAAVAHRPAGGAWGPARGDAGTLGLGDGLVVGGLLHDVLALAKNNGSFRTIRRRWYQRRPAGAAPRNRHRTFPWAATTLVAVLVLAAVVFALALDLDPVDALYKASTNAFGDVGLDRAPGWVKVFGVAVMLGGAVLVGIVLAQVTATLTASRLDANAGRRARRMRGHVVIAGLGMVGFRVDRLLDELDIGTVVIEQTGANRFREATAFRTPVLAGDARLRENLERANVPEAMCVVACTDDDLANVSTAVEARMLNPRIRTVVRIFDDDLADRLAGFGVDAALSMSGVAAGAFVGAATDERAVRHVRIDELELVAFRYGVERDVDASEVTAWREQGLRILAVESVTGVPGPPLRAVGGLSRGETVIVAGPEDVLARCLFG